MVAAQSASLSNVATVISMPVSNAMMVVIVLVMAVALAVDWSFVAIKFRITVSSVMMAII